MKAKYILGALILATVGLTGCADLGLGLDVDAGSGPSPYYYYSGPTYYSPYYGPYMNSWPGYGFNYPVYQPSTPPVRPPQRPSVVPPSRPSVDIGTAEPGPVIPNGNAVISGAGQNVRPGNGGLPTSNPSFVPTAQPVRGRQSK